MKNTPKFVKELIITLVIATLLSTAVVILLAWGLMALSAPTNVILYLNTLGASVWGLFVGYKLNSLLREYR